MGDGKDNVWVWPKNRWQSKTAGAYCIPMLVLIWSDLNGIVIFELHRLITAQKHTLTFNCNCQYIIKHSTKNHQTSTCLGMLVYTYQNLWSTGPCNSDKDCRHAAFCAVLVKVLQNADIFRINYFLSLYSTRYRECWSDFITRFKTFNDGNPDAFVVVIYIRWSLLDG